MHIYLIPGLGFDSRIFKNLDIQAKSLNFLEWIEPVKDEPIEHYAKRLSMQILHPKPVLIGQSFGGILCLEMANILAVEKIFLISSIRHPKELPLGFKTLANARISNFITPQIIAKSVPFWGKFYDYHTKEERILAQDMIRKNSRQYIRWALKTISTWNSKINYPQTSVYQIHGSKDKTFPIKKLDNVNLKISRGGHFMVYKHASEISKFINEKLYTE